jgi:hypothetical protein
MVQPHGRRLTFAQNSVFCFLVEWFGQPLQTATAMSAETLINTKHFDAVLNLKSKLYTELEEQEPADKSYSQFRFIVLCFSSTKAIVTTCDKNVNMARNIRKLQ